jgi:alpha-galactosidase
VSNGATFLVRLASLFVASFLMGAPTAFAATTVASAGDAVIAHDESAGTWILSAGGTNLTLTIDPTRDFKVVRLNVSTSNTPTWFVGNVPDTLIKIGDQQLPFGSRGAGFVYRDVTVDSNDVRLQLNAIFTLNGSGLMMTRHYAIVSGSPTFETWTSYAPATSAPTLKDLNALQVALLPGALHWLTGLDGDNADVEQDDAFTLKQQTLAPGGQFSIGAQGRASEQNVPWLAVDGAEDEFYTTLLWSGAWSLNINENDAGSAQALSLGLAPMSTVVSTPIDGPHALFGVVHGGLPQATAALQAFMQNGLRDGRAMTPLVTYNTWFAYGTAVDEPSMRNEMAHAAALGTELFVIDAGWYVGAGAGGEFDFDSGLGSWTVDTARFPNGLGPLRDYAHSLGMKFGLWVEPERVNLALVGSYGIDESMLATSGGNYNSDHAAQVCLGTAAGRAWLLGWLTGLLDQMQPDYLKWDNNMWVNCDRPGHDHGSTDGNFAHVNGLYGILSTIRQNYPDLMMENVSGGGNRLDVGMLRFSDTAWMDDRTAPSEHVRHNAEGLSAVFPPSYLLSFVTDHDTEPLHDPPDISLYFRSRMEGALGLCFRGDDFTEGENAAMAHEIDIYKTFRATQAVAAASLLTQQVTTDGPAWDVLEESAGAGGALLLQAFQTDNGVGKVNVKPTGLMGDVMYQVESADTGVIGTANGSDLMTNGIDLVQSPNTAAHILIITPVQ